MADGTRWVNGTAAAVALLIWFSVSPAHAGKLSDMREETGSSDESSSSSATYDDDDGCGLLAALLSDCDQAPGTYASGSPSSSRDELDETMSQSWFFPLYPYRGSVPGNLARRHFTLDRPVFTSCSRFDTACHSGRQVVACVDGTCYSDTFILDAPNEVDAPPVAQVQSARGQLQLDTGSTYDGLWRVTLGGSVDSHRGVGLESKLTYWVEPQSTLPTDSTLLGDVNLRVALLTLPAFQLRLGAGPRFQVDTVSESAGVNGTFAAELYPIEPVVLRLDADVGNLGKALVYEAQASLGVVLWRAEVLAGVSTLHIGEVAFDSAFAGIRFHL